MVRKKIKILLVDEHQMVRNGLRLMLERQNDFEFIVTEAENEKNILNELLANSYDIALLRINLLHPDDISTIKKINKEKVVTPVLIITMDNDQQIVKQVTKNGVSCYLLKDCGIEELSKAIGAILVGEHHIYGEAS